MLTNLLATGAAFGVAKWIFQDGALHSLLGFQSQGFLDAWGPVFFFAMIFAISMDYTVFLLSSAKEHWDRSHDPHEAMIGALAHSGRVIFAAGAVMVAVGLVSAALGTPDAPGRDLRPRLSRSVRRHWADQTDTISPSSLGSVSRGRSLPVDGHQVPHLQEALNCGRWRLFRPLTQRDRRTA